MGKTDGMRSHRPSKDLGFVLSDMRAIEGFNQRGTGSNFHLTCILTLGVLALLLMLEYLTVRHLLNIILFNFHESSADGVGGDGEET